MERRCLKGRLRSSAVMLAYAAASWASPVSAFGVGSFSSRSTESTPAVEDGDGSEAFASVRALREEVAALRLEMQSLYRRLDACGCGAAEGESAFEAGSPEEDPEQFAGSGEDLAGGGGLVQRVDVSDTAELKRVLFGGEPWLLHCDDGSGPKEKSLPAPKVFLESAEPLQGLARFGQVDCWERTPSGKTLAHRFDFPKPPVVFAVANGDPPLIVNLKGVAKPWQLRRKVQSYLQASILRISNQKNFSSFCTSRRACLVVGFKTAPMLADALKVLTPLAEKYRDVRAVAVDTSVWRVKLAKNLADAKPKKGQKDQADLLCVVRNSETNARGGAFFSSKLTAESAEVFMDRCSGGRGMVSINEAPRISQRPAEMPKAQRPQPSGEPGSSGGKTQAPTAPPTSSPSQRPSSRPPARTRAMPRYSSSGSRSGGRGRGALGGRGRGRAKKEDHVGSRDKLEEEEPLFSAVEDGEMDLEEQEEEETVDLDGGEL